MSLEQNTFFFFDRGLLQPQGLSNAAVHLCRARKDEQHNPLFTEGGLQTPPIPWEVRYDNAYPNVIFDAAENVYRCYYTLFTRDEDSAGVSRAERAQRAYRPTSGRQTSLAYAESRDGVHWVKPCLGLVDWEGSKENNLLFRYAHGTGVMLDEAETDPRKRYKLVTKIDHPYSEHSYMAVSFSPDGIHWEQMRRWPENNPAADSHNYVFRDPADGRFKLITRIWRQGLRVSALCESADFIHWSAPREIARGRGYEQQIYSMPVFPYRGLYLGLASMFHEGDRTAADFDTVDLTLRYGATPEHLDAVAGDEALIPRGEGRYPDGAFDCGCIFAAAPLMMEDKLCVYYMGGNGQHTNFRETSLARAFLYRDKLAYVAPRQGGGEMVVPTALLHIAGPVLEVLFDREAEGSLQVALYDRWNGQALPGCDFDDSRLSPAEDGYHRIDFAVSPDKLGRGTVCMVFKGRGVKLYALRGDVALGSFRRYYGEGHRG